MQRKRTMNIGTWNVQGIRGKQEEIVKEMKNLKIDIAALSETKKKGRGIEQIGDYVHIYSGVPKEQRAKHGISLLISKYQKKYITQWEAVNDRIVMVNMTIRGHRITVIGIYAPTNSSSEQENDEHIENLEEVLRKIGTNREIIMIGDMNARVGKRVKHPVVGQNGEEILNENGERLISLCHRHNLKIMNGYFKHKNIHMYTYTKEALGHRSIIDYIITKQLSNIKITDVKAHRGPNCGSDHYLVKAQATLQWKKDTRQQEQNDKKENEIKAKKYNIKILDEDSTRYLYQKRIKDKLKEEVRHQSATDIYEHITEVIHQAASEALGEKNYRSTNNNNNFWWTEELDNLKQAKQQAHQKWLQTKHMKDYINFKHTRAQFKRHMLEAKNEQWNKKCQEIEMYIGGRRTTESWKFIKSLRKQTKETIKIQTITNNEWERYFQELLTEERKDFGAKKDEEHPYNVQGEPIKLDGEILKVAVKNLKNNRATGPGGIPAELIKHGPQELTDMIRVMFEKCLNGDRIPEEWKESWITPIYKKGARDQCQNYRGLSVSSSFSRLYGRILTYLITQDYQEYQTEEQSGFRAGRSTVDNMFCIRQLIEKNMAVGREAHLVFIDLAKAYDSIPIKKLFEVLEESPINVTTIKAIKELYMNVTSKIKVGRVLTEGFPVTKGLRQGCSMSPILFNIYLDKALAQWKKKMQDKLHRITRTPNT